MNSTLKESKNKLDALTYLDPKLTEESNVSELRNIIANLMKEQIFEQDDLDRLDIGNKRTTGSMLGHLNNLVTEKVSNLSDNIYFPKLDKEGQVEILSQNLKLLEEINYADETNGDYTLGIVLRKLIKISAISREEIINNNIEWNNEKLEDHQESIKKDVIALKKILESRLKQLSNE